MKTVMRQPGTLPGHDADLRDPEFYEPGLVAEVICDYGRILRVERVGSSRLVCQETGEELRTATDFRNAWGSSGEIPDSEHGWDLINNGWFELYTPCGQMVSGDDVDFDLPEAIAHAQEWLITSGKRMLATAVQSAA